MVLTGTHTLSGVCAATISMSVALERTRTLRRTVSRAPLASANLCPVTWGTYTLSETTGWIVFPLGWVYFTGGGCLPVVSGGPVPDVISGGVVSVVPAGAFGCAVPPSATCCC